MLCGGEIGKGKIQNKLIIPWEYTVNDAKIWKDVNMLILSEEECELLKKIITEL